MKYKIKPYKEVIKDTVFLWLPRYCGQCGFAFWLQTVAINVEEISRIQNYALCPICQSHLYNDKSIARSLYSEVKK